MANESEIRADIPIVDTTRPPARERKPSVLAYNATGVIAELAGSIDADEGCSLLIVSSAPLPDEAKTAISNSAERLGFGADGCGWLVLGAKREADGGASDGSGPSLTSSQLWRAIEGLDPQAVIAADSGACAALSEAYNIPLTLGELNRVACRSVCAFADFAAMLSEKPDKQRAWALLKRLS